MNPWRAGRLLRGHGEQVLFGWGYEDPRIELDVFAPHGRVLVIAAAGETAAALAGAGHEVTAVDINPAQLDYCRNRLAGGPVRVGSAERLLRAGRAVVRAVDPAWRSACLPLHFDPTLLDSRRLRTLMRIGVGSAGRLGSLLHSGFQAAVPPRLDYVLLDRLRRGLVRHGAADNPWAWRLLSGVELPGYQAVRATDAVRLVRADVADHLESVPRGHYDAVSLSNVLDGPSPEFAARLRRAARHAVRPGGVVVVRSFRGPAPHEDHRLSGEDRSMLWGIVDVHRIS